MGHGQDVWPGFAALRTHKLSTLMCCAHQQLAAHAVRSTHHSQPHNVVPTLHALRVHRVKGQAGRGRAAALHHPPCSTTCQVQRRLPQPHAVGEGTQAAGARCASLGAS